ncbi:hypothetical protein HPB50_021883 [Hyalomma asiaticum]|uniref:Uncharacterized protein n=1 Tax=Hyalomma asiaticum TaxID=266040 RepID=A0ACB7SY90_HYAAI|nr:hypothetical protein HPB50_021883 [Hyalomma asiaticum]
MTIQVNINLDMHPTCVDLVFPDGVPKGGSVQLNLLRASSRFAYVNERECVPVVRRKASVFDQRYLEGNITVNAFHEDDGHPLCFLKATGARDAGVLYGEGAAASTVADNIDEPTSSPPALHETSDDADLTDVVEAGSDNVAAQEDVAVQETAAPAVRDKVAVPRIIRPRKKVTVFKCPECNKQFPADGLLRIHVRIYHGGPLKCKHCSSAFRGEQELDKHMLSDHLDRAPYRCSHCASAFFSADMMAVHQVRCPATREKKEAVACQLCEFTTPEASTLCQHIQEAHTEKVIYTCEPCGHLSLDFGMHQEHLKSHGPDGEAAPCEPAPMSRAGQSAQCPLCKKEFKNIRTLKEHIKRHPKSVRHVCELCGEGITTNMALIKHLNRHNKESSRRYRCLFCSKCFQTAFSVSRHMKNIHLFDHEHGCELCPHKFPTVREKADHMAKAHVVATPKGKRVHKCTDCNFMSENLGRFERHRASHTGVYPYECSECPRRFAAKEELSRHVHIIHPKGQQNCPHCPRLRLFFFLQDQLEFDTHVTLHDTGESHPCEECSHHFESAEALLEHRNKRHDLELPYECRLCHQRFCNIGQRVTHVRKYHPRVLLKSHVCDICGSAFRYQSGLAVHKLDKHTGRTEGRLFECEYCGKSATVNGNPDNEHYLPWSTVTIQMTSTQAIGQLQPARYLLQVRAATTIMLLQLWLANPALWFIQAENKFRIHRVTSEVHRNRETLATSMTSFDLHIANLLHHLLSNDHSTSLVAESMLLSRAFSCSGSHMCVTLFVVHGRRSGQSSTAVGDHDQSSSRFFYITDHTTGRRLLVDLETQVFGRSNVLAMHLRLHTGERPYLCQHCGMTFRNPTNLKYHTVNMHTKNYAVSCPICSRGFVVRRKLAKHLMQVHKVTGMVNTSSRKGRAKPVYIEHTTVPIVSMETGDDVMLNVMQIVETADHSVTATELSNAVVDLDSTVAVADDAVTTVAEETVVENVVDSVVEEAVEMVDISGVEFVSGANVECYTVS